MPGVLLSRGVAGRLRPCPGVSVALQEVLHQGLIQLHTNLPAVMRVSANGLLLDGGTTVLSHGRLDHTRCLVVSLPLGEQARPLPRGATC